MIGAIINDRLYLNAELGQGGMGAIYSGLPIACGKIEPQLFWPAAKPLRSKELKSWWRLLNLTIVKLAQMSLYKR